MMIKNERQYQFSKKRLEDWKITVSQLLNYRLPGTPVWVHNAQINGAKEECTQLKAQIKEYEELKSGKAKLADLSVLEMLPVWFVKWRIANNWTQKDLAEKLGVKEQQIQRYEESDYAGASLATLQKIAKVLYQMKSKRGSA